MVLDKGNPERDIFIKLKEGAHGDGAEICKWDRKKYKTSQKKLFSWKGLIGHISQHSNSDIIAQPRVKVNPCWSPRQRRKTS
jgi:hypothetical protein